MAGYGGRCGGSWCIGQLRDVDGVDVDCISWRSREEKGKG